MDWTKTRERVEGFLEGSCLRTHPLFCRKWSVTNSLPHTETQAIEPCWLARGALLLTFLSFSARRIEPPSHRPFYPARGPCPAYTCGEAENVCQHCISWYATVTTLIFQKCKQSAVIFFKSEHEPCAPFPIKSCISSVKESAITFSPFLPWQLPMGVPPFHFCSRKFMVRVSNVTTKEIEDLNDAN